MRGFIPIAYPVENIAQLSQTTVNIMKEFKGTPGPWELSQKDLDDPTILVYADHGIQGHICEMTNFADDYDTEANAKLIAAAPDLLEALQEMLPFAEQFINSNHPTHKKAISAIDKALGNN